MSDDNKNTTEEKQQESSNEAWPANLPRIKLNIKDGEVLGAKVISPDGKVTRHGNAGK
jgi:hypothetical protein